MLRRTTLLFLFSSSLFGVGYDFSFCSSALEEMRVRYLAQIEKDPATRELLHFQMRELAERRARNQIVSEIESHVRAGAAELMALNQEYRRAKSLQNVPFAHYLDAPTEHNHSPHFGPVTPRDLLGVSTRAEFDRMSKQRFEKIIGLAPYLDYFSEIRARFGGAVQRVVKRHRPLSSVRPWESASAMAVAKNEMWLDLKGTKGIRKSAKKDLVGVLGKSLEITPLRNSPPPR